MNEVLMLASYTKLTTNYYYNIIITIRLIQGTTYSYSIISLLELNMLRYTILNLCFAKHVCSKYNLGREDKHLNIINNGNSSMIPFKTTTTKHRYKIELDIYFDPHWSLSRLKSNMKAAILEFLRIMAFW